MTGNLPSPFTTQLATHVSEFQPPFPNQLHPAPRHNNPCDTPMSLHTTPSPNLNAWTYMATPLYIEIDMVVSQDGLMGRDWPVRRNKDTSRQRSQISTLPEDRISTRRLWKPSLGLNTFPSSLHEVTKFCKFTWVLEIRVKDFSQAVYRFSCKAVQFHLLPNSQWIPTSNPQNQHPSTTHQADHMQKALRREAVGLLGHPVAETYHPCRHHPIPTPAEHWPR